MYISTPPLSHSIYRSIDPIRHNTLRNHTDVGSALTAPLLLRAALKSHAKATFCVNVETIFSVSLYRVLSERLLPGLTVNSVGSAGAGCVINCVHVMNELCVLTENTAAS